MLRWHLIPVSLLLCALWLVPGASAGDEQPGGFPANGLLPKQETGASRFLEAHPTFDGRGVVVAVFDTGVDPGAPGLQTTSDGKPKILDVIDGTGSGDVDTRKTVTATAGAIAGRSGRTLRLDPAWKNPSGTWHIGLKSFFGLLPSTLRKRLKRKRRERFAEAQRAAVAKLERERALFRSAHPEPKDVEAETLADLQARLDELESLDEDYEDAGPMLDCVVWDDGTDWWAVLDTDEDGDLAEEHPLRSFRVAREYATFSEESRLNYCLNVYARGDVLSIVVDAGAHGTHVAGIVAAHFEEQPELNGIAPGAQIVAVKIGDSRMDASSFGTGPERGITAVLAHGCDLINMSYGGATRRPGAGRVVALYRDLVQEHDVLFVSSAGNEGPGLSTVGGPGGTTDAIFGVGAYVSPAMMRAQMSVREELPGIQFTWSSRGPTSDGDLGVDFSAPGGAISPVPAWSLQRSMQMSGTSMSSPNACGALALLLSGMKAEKIPVSPGRVRRALVNTAAPLPDVDPWGAGHGMLQVDHAWEHLVQGRARPDADVRFQVTLPRRRNARGVYLREPHETDRVLQTSVKVEPKFAEKTPNASREALELRLALECTADWVDTGDFLYVTHGENWFSIRVDPTGLSEGAHYAEVRAFDVNARERGPLFRIPVTVIRPRRVDASTGFGWKQTIAFEPGRIERRFFAAPEGATWADLTVHAAKAPTDKLFVVQTTQLAAGRAYEETHTEHYLRLRDGETEGIGLDVQGGRTLELALAQYWSSLGPGSYDVTLRFHGIVPRPDILAIDGNRTVTRLDVSAPFRGEDLEPRAQLDVLRKQVRPERAEIHPLTRVRDGLPKQQVMHEAILTYALDFDFDEPVKARIGMHLDDEDGGWSEFSSMLWQLYDEGKQLVQVGAAGGSKVKLEGGTYTLRVHLRHPDPARLEAVRDTAAFVDIELEDPIDLSFYAWGDDALSGKHELKKLELRAGEQRAFFVPQVPWDDLPYEAEPGDLLMGSFSLGLAEESESGPGRRPAGFPVWMTVPSEPAEAEDEREAEIEPEDLRTVLAQARDTLRDARIENLASLREDGEADAFRTMYAEAEKRYPGHIPLLLEGLRAAYGDGPPFTDKRQAARVEAAAGRIIAAVDADAVARAAGVRYDKSKPKDLALKARAHKRREALVEALYKQAKVLLAAGASRAEAFEKTWLALRRLQDMEQTPYLWLRYEVERRHGHLGKALEIVESALKEDAFDRKAYEKRIELFEKLGWTHWVGLERRWMLRRFPPDGFDPF